MFVDINEDNNFNYNEFIIRNMVLKLIYNNIFNNYILCLRKNEKYYRNILNNSIEIICIDDYVLNLQVFNKEILNKIFNLIDFWNLNLFNCEKLLIYDNKSLCYRKKNHL